MIRFRPYVSLLIVLYVIVDAPRASRGESDPLDLDRRTMERAEKALAWLVGIKIDDSNRASFDRAFSEDWRSWTGEQRTLFLANVAEMESAQGRGPYMGEVLRLQFRAEIFRPDGSRAREPLKDFLLNMSQEVDPEMAPGPPPLTRSVANATAGLLVFIYADLQGISAPEVPPATQEQIGKTLQRRWPELSDSSRQGMAEAPLMLAILRYKWGTLPNERKELMRQSWRRQFPNWTVPNPPTQPPAAPAVAAAAGGMQTAKQPTTPSAPAKSTRAKAEADRARQAQCDQIMANIQAQMHEMNMAIVRNIAAIPGKGEYRWVPR